MDDPVLLLGARGFIGAHLRATFAASSRTFRVAPRWGAGANLEGFRRGLTSHLDTAERWVVVNALGGRSETSMLDRINVAPLEVLLEVLASRGAQDSLVHIGSAAEYARSDCEIDEGWLCEPVDDYGRSKLRATTLALSYKRGMVLRLFNVIGHGMPSNSLFGRLSTAVRKRESHFSCGSLNAIRDFISVRDVSTAVELAVQRCSRTESVASEVVNIGSGTGYTVRDVVNCMVARARSDILVIEREEVSGVPRSVASVAKARHLLNWSSRRSIDFMITELVQGSGRGIS